VEVPGVTLDPKQVAVAGAIPGYFETMGLRTRAGRWFTVEEFAGSAPVAVIDERMAALAWPDAGAIGRQIRVGPMMHEVVGVVATVRTSLSRPMPVQLYVPASITSGPSTNALVWAPEAALPDLQPRIAAAVHSVAPGTWIRVSPITMDRLFMREIGEARFQTPIVLAFGALAFLLAGVGVFGLVSYLAERRQREFGIRLALGARPADIWRTVSGLCVTPAIAGLAIGAAGAWALESVVRSSVFGWESSGAGAFALVTVALLLVAVLASLAPARRAMRTDPAITLRAE
jgi:TRAP-type C4-dicarboxylate transport system permease small subunit